MVPEDSSACYACYGRGYADDSLGRRETCKFCHGTGEKATLSEGEDASYVRDIEKELGRDEH